MIPVASAPQVLEPLLERATALGLPVSSLGPGGSLVSLEAAWKEAAEAAEPERRIPILDVLAAFAGPKPGAFSALPPLVVEISPDRQTAFLSLLKPRPGRPPAEAADIEAELKRAGVAFGVDPGLVEACAAALRREAGWVLRVPVARGTRPSAGKEAYPEFQAPTFSVEPFRTGKPWTAAMLLSLKPVAAGAPLGQLHPGIPGTPGKDVTGRLAPPLRPAAPLSERIAVDSRGRMTARAEGVLARGPSGWDLVPLFRVQGDYRPESGPIRFPGIVAVEGSCRDTPIEADELYVGGDLAGGQVVLRGDVHVAGLVSGGTDSSLSADGTVTARAIDGAKVDALGDILVRRAIVNAELTTLGRAAVTEAGGEISGGTVAALRGVEAPTLGSDFGVPTSIAAGRDFLTPKRLSALETRIALHQDNLKRIADLKRRLALAHVNVRQLPPDKQDIYIGVLKKETGSKQELAMLERQRERFRQACADLLEATIRVGETLKPPVQIQIRGALVRIQERLRAVILAGEGDTITTTPAETP